MRVRLATILRFLIFWLGLFVAAKVLFLCYNHEPASRLDAGTIAGIFWHGLPMDFSSASYLTIVPGLVIALSALVDRPALRRVLLVVTGAEIILVTLLTTADLEVYRAWGMRIDSTPLDYLKTPRESWVAIGSSPLTLLIVLLTAFTLGGFFAAGRFLVPSTNRWRTCSGWAFLGCLFATLLLFVPIRGGFQQIPLNHSRVYFSSDRFANQAALNAGWNFFASVNHRQYRNRNPYHAVPDSLARRVVDSLFAQGGPRSRLLHTERPNILIIIWESLNPKVVAHGGGLPGITPALDSAMGEGIRFDRFYSSGDRTEKGVISVLSGYPAPPRGRITDFPAQSSRLPFLSQDLARVGYHSAFYKGGELAFANLGSYLLNGRFERLVEKRDFDRKDWSSKWGAHDRVVFQRALNDAARDSVPWFKVVLTLSSHEPFDTPIAPGDPQGTDEQTLFLNAMRYSDRSLGEFLAEARRASWWNNTLLIILADHGHRLPDIHPGEHAWDAERFRIPMLWLGGALIPRDSVVHDVGGQTDVAPTLLGQLGLPSDRYRWGRDLFKHPSSHLAYFTFHDGFGFIDERGSVVYDNAGGQLVSRTGRADTLELRLGKSLQQAAFQSFLDQ